MKYIKLFETHSLYEAYIADTVNFVRPNVSYCEDYSHVHYNNLLEISSALITCDSAIYNGETQIATNIVVMLGSVVLTNNTDYIVINNNGGINAGSYTFTIRGIGNYKGYKNGTFIINKMTPTVVAPTAKVLTYNGSAQELINAGSTNAGTLQYKVDDGSWSTNIPTGTNGGSYNVLYKVVGNNNVNDVEALSILCSINEKEVTATVELSLDTYTYSGNAYEPTVTVKDGGTIIPSSEYTVTYSNNINAGTATVTIIDNTGGNYAVIGSTTFTIEKATGSVTTIPVNKAVTYNESAQIVADAGAGTGTMMYRLGDSGDFSSSMPTATNAGTYTLYFYAAESANYLQSATQNIEVTISKAIPSYTSPQGKNNLIYSGEAQELLIEGSSPDGIIKYSDDEGETWTTDIPEGINVVTYHLQWKVFGDSNHTDSTPINIDVSIAKVTPTVTAPTIVSNLEYTGEAQNLLNNDGSTNFGTLQYSNDNETFSTTIPTGTNAGSYDVWYRVQGDSNVNDVSSVKLTNSIAKVDACYIAPTAATGLVYDESSQALLNAGSSTCGTVLYSSDETNWSTNIPEGTNAGDYTSYWRVVADSNHIDKPSASITTNIDKAAGEIYTAPTPITELVYNDTALSLITAGSGTGTMQYKVDSGSWESSIPTMINAGTYTIYYKVLESSNYYATDGTDYITTTIAKVTPTVTAPTPRVLTYNTSSLALVNAGSTDWGTLQYSLDDSTWSTNIPEAINYGSYTVYYRVVGNSNINDVPSASVACSIAEKRVSTPTIELDPTGYTYSGNQCKPSVTVKDGSHVIPASEYTVTYSNNTNAGTATVIISDNTAGNYNITGTKDFTISKAPGEVTTKPTAKSLIYTGNSQELINAGSGTGTMYYRLGTSGSFSTEIPSATNAGTYTVYFYAAESNNYLQSTPTESVNVIIAEKAIVIPTPTGYTGQYDGNAHTATFPAIEGATITSYSYSTDEEDHRLPSDTNPSLTNVGTLYTRAYYTASTNYTGSGFSDKATITITPLILSNVTATLNWASQTYNGNVQVPTITVKNGSTTLTSGTHYTLSYSNSSSKNAGSYSITVSPTSNYSFTSIIKNYTISKRQVTLSWGTTSWVYDGLSHSTTCTAGNLVSGDTCNVIISNNSVGPNVNTVPLNFSLSNSNYSLPDAGCIIAISERPINVTAGSTSKTYDGSALTYNSATAEGTGTNRGLVSGHSMTSCTVSGTITNVGSTNNVPSSAVIKSGSTDVTSNYSISYVNGTLTINYRSVTYTATNESWTYNGNTHSASNTATLTSGSLASGHTATFSCSGSVGPNVGSSTKTLDVTIKSGNTNVSGNYNIARVWGTLSITKANQSAPIATGATVGYGSTATATASGGGRQGSIEWSNGNTQTSVGSKTTKARWSGNSNYNTSDWSNEVTLTVVADPYNGHDYVEIGGLKWATMNIGANSVTDYGLYFQWGDTQGYTASQCGSGEGQKYFGWADYKYGNGTSSPGATGMTKYNSTDGKTVLDLSDDAARVNMGGLWRMPTTAEFQALGNAVNFAWTADYQGSGVSGLVLTDKTDSSKVLFFPAAGGGSNGSVLNVGSFGFYWSSSVRRRYFDTAYRLRFYSSRVVWQDDIYRYNGFPVRGVIG